MKNRVILLLMMLVVLSSTVACGTKSKDLGISNFRTALDSNGKNPTTTLSPPDTIYAVVDLAESPRGTKLEVRWVAVEAENTERNKQFDSQTFNVTDEIFTGTTYFQVSNAAAWPKGRYRVDLYVNEALANSVEFKVQ